MKDSFKLSAITKVLICAFLFIATIIPNNAFADTNTKKINANNSRVTVTFKHALTTTPKITDFVVTQSINKGISKTVKSTKITIDSTKKIITLTVPVISKISVIQNIVYKVSYKKDTVVNTPIIIVAKLEVSVKPVRDNTVITSKFTDVNFKAKVYSLIHKVSPDPILYSDLKKIKTLELQYVDINSLNGIEYFTALTALDCQGNKLTTLDVSKNINLKTLDCRSNMILKTIDVSKNRALTTLYCFYNNLKTLDVSNNTALTDLECDFNSITTLDVSKNIGLTTLWCSGNKLTTLDVSKNTALDDLTCINNQLIALDVSKNKALTELWCGGNQLKTLDVSKNTALTYLECINNQLTTLDVSKNVVLTRLSCYDNQLTALYIANTLSDSNYWYNMDQYTDSSHTTTANNLVVTINN